MSIARHHAEWLSLVEASGPFISLQVLLEAFPQGLDAHDSDLFRTLRLAYEEWLDSRRDTAIHRAWVNWVLTEQLEFPEEVLLSGQAVPPALKVTFSEHQLTLRPDWVVVDPDSRKPRLLVQMVPPEQGLEKTYRNSRWKASPATGMMELLHATDVRLGLLTNGEQWMLVNAPRGESAGFISWYANLWLEEKLTLRAFRSLLGVRRFFAVDAGETLADLLARSKDAQQEVTDQLGFQVRKAVEVLVQSLDRIDQDRQRTLLAGLPETALYQAALTVMMRLVFLFSAEERGLLLLGDPLYDQFYAVSTLRAQLRELADQAGEELLERRFDAWVRLLATFRAVHGGIHHDALQLPAYGGQLFDPDRFPFLEGRASGTHWRDTPAAPIPINNRTVLHLLEALQLLQIKVGGTVEPRKLSFRALDIEQIGHVYEGLLDHTAVRAEATILGLEGTKNKEPEVALEELERLHAKGEDDLLAFLQKETGRSVSALKKRILPCPPLPPSLLLPQGEQGEQENPPVPLSLDGRGARGEGAKGAGGEGLDSHDRNQFLIACHNDPDLFQRVLPWAELIRRDTFEHPTVIPAGSVFVTQGTDRRETGTHYTPKSLTEEIVKYTLEPLIYEGVAEGKPKEEWRLKSAAALLALKVCDMAMGSGAFLVQVCRYLSERLVEAWEMEIPPNPPTPSPTGREGEQEATPIPLSLDGRGARGEGDQESEGKEPERWEIPEAIRQKMVEVARQFRKEPTPSEDVLWQALRGKKLEGRKFRRQQPIGSFIVDFFCSSERLIVEVDGGIHETQKEYDRQRQSLLESLGLRFARVNSSLVESNLSKALEQIKAAFAPVHSPLPPNPLLPQGEQGGQENSPVPLSLDGRGAGGEGQLRILPDGSLSTAEPGEAILPHDPDERLAVARRIVADRCLYGVDKNPMAVEMAKLSLWLITLQKNRPFTFLDHALRCGDSLLGVTSREQIEFLHLNPDKEAVQLRTVSEIWRPLLAQAIAKRKELESFTVNDIQDLARKETLQAEAEELTRNIKIAADYLIGEALAQAGKTGNLKVEDLGVLSGLVTAALEEPDERERENKLRQIREKAQLMLNAGKPEGQPPREPFHWALEFPEVFLEEDAPKGFSAIVGNPPFQGGQKITGTVGTDYRNLIVEHLANGQRGSADICSYFFLNAGKLLMKDGSFGLVATNTIAQGDTREVGLDQLVAQGYTIPRAVPSRPWPGTASLEVAYVWLHKGEWRQKFVLNEDLVDGITAFLTMPGKAVGKPYRLAANKGLSFQGSIVLGAGFVLKPHEAKVLSEKNPKNKDVLFPYLNGQDLNSNFDQSPSRWVINFRDWPLDAAHDDPKKLKGPPYAADYPDCLAIVEDKVKPERAKNNRAVYRDRWWHYAEKRPALYDAISECNRVLVTAQTSRRWAPAFQSLGIVYSHSTIIFRINTWSEYAVMQAFVHEEWRLKYGPSLRQDARYTPSDCFETFPFPENTDTLETPVLRELEAIGEHYYTHRQTIMQTRQEGLTKTYNRFHDPTQTDPDIQTLRDLHIQMDTAVAAAYGWHDLTLNHDFHETKQGLRFTISEAARREVLDRLLELNHQRYAAEVAQGLHDKKKGRGKKKAKPKATPETGKYATQGNLFSDTTTQGELF